MILAKFLERSPLIHYIFIAMPRTQSWFVGLVSILDVTEIKYRTVQIDQSTTRGGNEAFVAKLAPNGSSLVYSTYLGSNGNDFAFGIAVDGAGHAYVTGSTDVPSFPNNNAVVCSGVKRTGADAFVVKLDATGATVSYCAFIGGAGTDTGGIYPVCR